MSNEYVKFSGDNPFGSQAKMLLHFEKLHEYLSTGDTTPIFMEIGLTDRCNENCYWCITESGRDNKNGAEIKLQPLLKFFVDFETMGGKALTFCGQGEPTKYPYFIEATSGANEAGLQLGLMTNGVFPKKLIPYIGNCFEWTRFSLDTLDAAKYKEWKELDGVATVLRNVKALGEYPVKIGINCNIGPNITRQMILDLIAYLEDTPEAAYLQFRPILPRFYKKEEGQLNEAAWKLLDEYRDHPRINLSDDKRAELASGDVFQFRSCEGHFFEPIITALGEVKVCTYHPWDKKLTFGNIYNSSFKEIWESQQRQEAIKYVRGLNYRQKCQQCCKLAEPNKLIDFLKHPEETKDVNFL